MDPIYIFLIVLGSLLFLLLILYFLIGIIGFHFVFNYYRRKPRNESIEIPFLVDKEFIEKSKQEDISIKSFDKTILRGKLIRNSSHKYFITVHGYQGIYSENSAISHVFFDKGYNILRTSYRGHNISKGKYFTMGAKEGKDVACWVNEIVKEDVEAEIVLYGLSMGAFTVMRSLKEVLPSNLKCAIEDCGYHSLLEELRFSTKSFSKIIPACISLSSLNIVTKMHGFDINCDVKEALSKNIFPTLFIHGEKDQVVPFKNLELNYDSMNNETYKEKHSFSNAKHAMSLTDNKEEYVKIVTTFADKFIK